MRRATVVIGSNFGDEGKGLMTDYFASLTSGPKLVVRFNGGAQAGHTVVDPKGGRHVFSHFGSGTFVGSNTYLSQFFVVNPVIWEQEFQKLGQTPNVYVHTNAPLTTIYDMAINQALENSRGSDRHGSVGVGIFETLTRSKTHRLVTSDIWDWEGFRQKVTAIRDEYVPRRLSELGLTKIDQVIKEILRSDEVLEGFLEICLRFSSQVEYVWHTQQKFAPWPTIIFEGAQGLLLDQDHPYFPHVTPSKTGLYNVILLAYELGIDELEVVYVTRSYLTRHGAGPFPTEDKTLYYQDPTNKMHPFQGSLRFGRLDPEGLAERIRKDFGQLKSCRINATLSLAVTCLDQVTNSQELLARLRELIKPDRLYASYGPTRNHVRVIG